MKDSFDLKTCVLLFLSIAALQTSALAAAFQSDFQNQIDRVWVGPEYWSNPLQDWRISSGRLECVNPGPERNVHLLTHQLASSEGDLNMSVQLKLQNLPAQSRVGFRIGIRGPLNDYRYALIHGSGLDLGVTADSRLFIGELQSEAVAEHPLVEDIELRMTAEPAGSAYRLTLTAYGVSTERECGRLTRSNIAPDQLVGNLALLCDVREPVQGSNVFFSDWRLSGSKVEAREGQTFGPILFSQYTLSRGVMKMTVQMAPVGPGNSRSVSLQIWRNESWNSVAEQEIDPLSRTATFRVRDWDSARDVRFRLAYSLKHADGSSRYHYFDGTVRRDPVDKQEIVIAGFTGNTDAGFPNTRVVSGVRHHDPDLLVFTGDQLYESVGGYGVRRTSDVELATLDYLRKWYIFGWAFRDLMRDRPTICLPDDHDVYQPNIWGAGGRSVPTLAAHPRGGYFMPAVWVNMVQRTQTSHLPDPYDPAPIEQGIGVYYTSMNYGRISIAILEDRKFKSGPEGLTPETTTGRPDHVQASDFDPQSVDLPEAVLLGKRQLQFLREWAADWRDTDMKLVVSQTIFANVPNIHGAEKTRLVADLDSNSWPQSGRNRALHEMRRGFAFHLSGDQHLPMIVHYGINEWGDAPYTICVPSIAAGYPRAFRPERPGKNRQPGMPSYTGEFRDGFANKMTVWAVANPSEPYREGVLERLHDKASGYGIVRFNKQTQEITLECWPLLSDPSDDSQQFAGWPKTIHMQDNYARSARAYLPTIEVTGMEDPVIQVISEWNDEIVYTLRVKGRSFRPKVFKDFYSYTVKVGEPGTDKMRTMTGIEPTEESGNVIRIAF